jgi:hypothetical protein
VFKLTWNLVDVIIRESDVTINSIKIINYTVIIRIKLNGEINDTNEKLWLIEINVLGVLIRL